MVERLGLLDYAKRAFGLSTNQASAWFLSHDPAASGERVTEESCWSIVPVYRALTVIGNDIAKLPVSVVSGEGRATRPVSSVATDLLGVDANEYHSGFEFRRTLTTQALRYGNAFAQIVRSGRGEVLALIPLLPHEVTLHVIEGVVTYRHAHIGEVPHEDILHIRAPGGDGLWGESPISQAREALGLMKAMEKAGGALYKNAGVPKLAFVHPGTLSAAAQQSIVDSYLTKHGGPANAGRPLVLGEGMRIEKINQTLEDQMWQVAREFSIQEVSRLFGVPVVYLADHSRSTFASIVELTSTYWDACLSHWCAVWAEEVRRKLLAPGQRLQWDTRDLLKGSFADQVASLRSAIEVGLLTQNEARDRLGLAPVDGGDEILRPANTLVGTDPDTDDDEDNADA